MSPTASIDNTQGASTARRCWPTCAPATGPSGDNAEYVLETHDHLQAIGVRDRDLEWFSAKLRAGQ